MLLALGIALFSEYNQIAEMTLDFNFNWSINVIWMCFGFGTNGIMLGDSFSNSAKMLRLLLTPLIGGDIDVMVLSWPNIFAALVFWYFCGFENMREWYSEILLLFCYLGWIGCIAYFIYNSTKVSVLF